MIDVIFLLLVFFIYAMVLMVRVDLVPMELHSFETGQPAEPAPAATISIDLTGTIFLDRQEVALRDLAARVEERKALDPATVIYLAVADGVGTTDRAPILQDVWDRLRPTGLTINLVGRPSDSPSDTSVNPAPTTVVPTP